MSKMMISLVAVLSLAACKKGGGNDSIAKMEGFQKAMCECKDKACADKVQDDMTKWGTEMAKTAKPDDKPDPEMVKKSGEIMTKYTECMTKLMTAAMTPHKTDEPKKDEPKKDEVKTDEPKKDETKADEPKKDEPKKDEPKKDDGKKPDDKKAGGW
jgi:hypothetical protein